MTSSCYGALEIVCSIAVITITAQRVLLNGLTQSDVENNIKCLVKTPPCISATTPRQVVYQLNSTQLYY